MNLNNKLKSKSYTISNISEMLLNLEGFKYYMLLDLNIRYCHIELSEDEINLCTIFLILR